jgi:hypothetical protein
MSSTTADDPFADVRWTTLSLDDFRDLYWDAVAPRLEAAGRDPETHRPTHQWFRDEGLRAFLAALRRHHDPARRVLVRACDSSRYHYIRCNCEDGDV